MKIKANLGEKFSSSCSGVDLGMTTAGTLQTDVLMANFVTFRGSQSKAANYHNFS